MNEYEQQAADVLSKHNINLTIIYDGMRKYFPDDTEARKVYAFSLENFNTGARYSGTFGASLANGTCTPYGVLSCLTKSDPGTFEDFCSEYGYDEDSRKAYRVYLAVREEWQGVMRVFNTDEALNDLAEVQ